MSIRRRKHGLTLVEVLVAMAILSLIGLMMVQIFSQSRTVFDRASSTTDIHHKLRETMHRVQPILMSSVPDAGAAIDIPSPGVLRFVTTEDLLGGTAFSPGALTYRTYQLRLDNAGDADVLNDRLVLEQVDPDAGFAVMNPPTPRVLSNNSREASIFEIIFASPSDGVVRVTIRARGVTRNAARQTEQMNSDLQTVVQLPHFSTK
ncbi:MAG: prepilin-type N-terminal cleavage/methylation domain-containing protein [Armatimonadetes bacterium]|nr:prepilin-type N-terminal cleavage/methylation domain-containing protein [Armatimonadota bacterium]